MHGLRDPLAPPDSQLAAILARATSMPVVQASDGLRVEPGHVYVIPPNRGMTIEGGALRLGPRAEHRGQPRTIDNFLRSLAAAHGERSIGIILSGTGSDGAVGIEQVKGAGGITFAQDTSAEHGGMPRSAIATGAVDFVLSPADMGHELARIASHPFLSHPAGGARDEAYGIVDRIVEAVRETTGVDFSGYRRGALVRRIARRMALHECGDFARYLDRLRTMPAEAEALSRDVLAGVTSFFHDPEAFEALKREAFPRLAAEPGEGETVRMWSLGCATGEEAYSLAIAYSEHMEALGRRAALRVFATDLNGMAIAKARQGIYAKGIAHDMAPERLERFFAEDERSYRVRAAIRELCIFSRHNALADPPFSKVDLLACRNLLPMLEPPLQQRLMGVAHFALRDGGVLMLGKHEAADAAVGTLFEPLDAGQGLYVRKARARPSTGLLPQRVAPTKPAIASAVEDAPPAAVRAPDSSRVVDQILLSRYAPPAVVVDSSLEILQFRGDTSPWLAPAAGRERLDLPRMLRKGLAPRTRAAIERARRDKLPAREDGIELPHPGGRRVVDVVVVPVVAPGVPPGLLLVAFEERRDARDGMAPRPAPATAVAAGEAEAARLRGELEATRDYLQSVIEQQEGANEELVSANEEIRSANEELETVNEELETSREEIRSANEELAMVNAELRARNEELQRSGEDMANLLGSVQLVILMLGPDLRVRSLTPAARKLFGLGPGDIGRAISDVKRAISGADLEALSLEVAGTGSARESEVQDRHGRWHSLRVRPYRTVDGRVDGVVVMVVDIDQLKRASQALRESEARFEVLADSAPVLIWMDGLEGCRFVNRAFEQFVGATEEEVCGKPPGHYLHPDDRAGYLQSYAAATRDRAPFEARARLRRADGAWRWMKFSALPRFLADGNLLGYVGCTIDVTDMKEAEAALVDLDRLKNEFLATLAHELRNPLSGIAHASRLLREPVDPAHLAHAREVIERQAAHMARMVEDLLDISRITHGKIELRPEPVELRGAVDRAVEATAPQREAAGQRIGIEGPGGPLVVQGDPVRLEQVFCNLLQNASKFTPPGGRIQVSLARLDGSPALAELRFRDNGVGMTPDMLRRVFDLFVQGDDRHGTRSGMGLGLTLARRLVELHGGSIEARSEGPGAGSEFVVRLPIAAAPASRRPAKKARPAGATSAGARRRILIVDDNQDSAHSLAILLRMAGHDVHTVADGASALPKALSLRPAVVLLDIGLPDIDGREVARRLRAEEATRDALLIVVSGYGRPEDVRRSLEAGIDVHLTKPVDPEALAALIAGGRPPAAAA